MSLVRTAMNRRDDDLSVAICDRAMTTPGNHIQLSNEETEAVLTCIEYGDDPERSASLLLIEAAQLVKTWLTKGQPAAAGEAHFLFVSAQPGQPVPIRPGELFPMR
jgi:hypothetical protein